MSMRHPFVITASVLLVSLLTVTSLLVGCGSEQKPTFYNFYEKDNESVASMEPIIEELEQEYEGKVIFKNVDMSLDENKDLVEEYHVTTAPTYVVTDKEGMVRETFLGAARKEMLERAISSQLPSEEQPEVETEGTTPGTKTPAPETILPQPAPETEPPQ